MSRRSPEARAAAAAMLAATLLLDAPRSEASAALDWVLHCQGCHLADGSATPGSVPAVAGSAGRLARLPEGRAYLVRVPGVAQAPLSDAALAALLNWMLLHFDPRGMPDPFVPFAAEEVARLRKAPLVDVEGERRRVMERLARLEGGR